MKKNHVIFYSLLLFLIVISFMFFYIGPVVITEAIGVNNSYLLTFVLASLGAFSSLTAGPFYAIIITFGAGGANPLYLGLIAGVGITIGDSIYYLLGHKGRDISKGRLKFEIDRFSSWLNKKPKETIALVIFLYAAFAPLPNDILTASVGVGGYKYKYAIVPLALGNIIHMMIIIYAGSLGYSIFFS